MNFRHLVLLLGLIVFPAVGQEGPRIEIQPLEHDFGRVTEGEKATHQFLVKNHGTADLVIEKTTASCGCTLPVTKERTIAPGDSTPMSVKFDSSGRQGTWRGSVTLYTNDPDHPRANVQLQAEVVPEVRISETYLYFGEIFRGTREAREIEIENVCYPGLEVEKFHIEGGDFEVELLEGGPLSDAGGKARFRITLQENAPYGYTEGNLYVRTNYERTPLFRVFLIARIKGYVEISRPRIDFGILIRRPELSGRKEKVAVYSHRESIEICKVDTDLEYLEIDVETVEAGKSYQIVLEVTDGMAVAKGEEVFPARIQGTLKIETTSTERPHIELPIQMIVKTEE